MAHRRAATYEYSPLVNLHPATIQMTNLQLRQSFFCELYRCADLIALANRSDELLHLMTVNDVNCNATLPSSPADSFLRQKVHASLVLY